jgi:hypothetical protein
MQVPVRTMAAADVRPGAKAIPRAAALPRSRLVRMMGAMRGLLFVLACCPAAAQIGPKPARPAPTTPYGVQIEAVVATVNDSPILLSELRTQAAGTVRTEAVRLGRQLAGSEIALVFRRELELLLNRHMMAQAAKTFGIVPPEVVEDWFQRELKREEEEQVRDLGTVQDFSLELQRTGRTWPTHERKRRVELLADFAEGITVDDRLRNQRSLYLTPRMLREAYARERERFVHDAVAKLHLVQFNGPNAAADAAAASALWAKEALSAAEVAGRFPGAIAIAELPPITTQSRATLAKDLFPLLEFALAGPVGAVSQPVGAGSTVHIGKVIAYIPARNAPFEAPAVQEELRVLCEGEVRREFRQQALERAAERTETWRADMVP